MGYTLPVFNLTCNIWRNGIAVTNPPAVISSCNLALGRRVGQVQGLVALGGDGQGAMWLLLPIGTDIQDVKNGIGPDRVEVPAGSGRYYNSVWVDDIGAGFANEHRFAELIGVATWPLPFPSGVAPAGLAGGLTIQTAIAVVAGTRFIAQVPPATTMYFSVPVCCTPIYQLEATTLPGAATVSTLAPPTAAPVVDIPASGSGVYTSTFPPLSTNQVFIKIVGDPVLTTSAGITVGPVPGQVVAGGVSCVLAVDTAFPVQGRIFVPFGTSAWFRIPRATGSGYTVTAVPDDGTAALFAFGGAVCPGALEINNVAGTSQTAVAGGAHTGPFIFLQLKSGAAGDAEWNFTVT